MTVVRFEVLPGDPVPLNPEYCVTDHSFDVSFDDFGAGQWIGKEGVTSIAIVYLQIEVDIESRRALYAWGLHSNTNWIAERLDPVGALPSIVRVYAEPDLLPGVSIRIGDNTEWSTSYDESSGWVCIARVDLSVDLLGEIATGTLLGFADGELASVWIRPSMIK
ncbi:hypothetical protein AB0L82_17800 [Nocardia sp. NPDC052001]|uniref:hypothetical protein n=1 Tax=Nocardia sp. NPDC052001 TaxID=3154853 RepID=UPI00342B064F